MSHIITLDTAGELDMAFVNAANPTGMLRMVDHRVSGNRTVTLLEVPGDDSAPTYQRVNGHFQHIAGPTLDEWQAKRDAAELEAVLEAEYRDAADTERDLLAGLHW